MSTVINITGIPRCFRKQNGIVEDRKRRASLSVRYKHYHWNETVDMYNIALTPLAGSYTEQRVPEFRKVHSEAEDSMDHLRICGGGALGALPKVLRDCHFRLRVCDKISSGCHHASRTVHTISLLNLLTYYMQT